MSNIKKIVDVDEPDYKRYFYINYDNKTITCTIEEDIGKTITRRMCKQTDAYLPYVYTPSMSNVRKFIGTARLDPEHDVYDEKNGMKVARYKAECTRRKIINNEIKKEVKHIRYLASQIEIYGTYKPPVRPECMTPVKYENED